MVKESDLMGAQITMQENKQIHAAAAVCQRIVSGDPGQIEIVAKIKDEDRQKVGILDLSTAKFEISFPKCWEHLDSSWRRE
jgi:hypothetical protein